MVADLHWYICTLSAYRH